MYYPIGDNIWLYLFDFAILEALAIYTWKFRALPGAMTFIIQQGCKVAWLLFLVLIDLSHSLQTKIFWMKLQQIAAVFSPYLWLLFIWQLSSRKTLPHMINYFFRSVIIFLWVTVLTNSWHNLYWKEILLEGQTVSFSFGPIGWVALANSYIMCVVSVVLGVRWILNTTGLRRRQALWFVMPGIFTWGGHVLWRIHACQFLAPQALGFLMTSVFITWAYYRWHVYSILPLAEEVALQNMIDGLVVVDNEGYVVNMNLSAVAMFKGLPAVVGKKFQDVVPVWPELAGCLEKACMEVSRADIEKYFYRVNCIPLANKRGRHLGKIFLLTDITRQKQDQAKMMEQQKTLSVLVERNRLGRELHDTQGQFPAYVKTQAQAIKILLGKNRIAEASDRLDQLIEAADAAFTDVRESISGLKTNISRWDFFKNLEHWFEQFHKITGIVILYDGPNALPDKWIMTEAEVQLFRIIQELLNNIRKHAGASLVQIRFVFQAEYLVVTVTDDGCGFDMEKLQDNSANFGLSIIQERAADFGGICRLYSSPGEGTVVTIEIPLCKP